jgi:hypothetical protein
MRIDDAVIERHIEVTLDRRGLAAPCEPFEPAAGRPRWPAVAAMLLGGAIVIGVGWLAREPAPAVPTLRRVMQDPPSGDVIARSEDDLARLPADLQALEVRRLPDAAFAALRRFSGLRRLVVSGQMDEDEGGLGHVRWPLPETVPAIVADLQALESLEFVAAEGVDPPVLHRLVGLRKLSELRLRRCEEASDDHVAVIALMQGLTKLTIEADGGRLTRLAAQELARLPVLTELRLRGVYALGREGYLALASLPRLHVLDVSAPWYLGTPEGVSERNWPTSAVDEVDDAFVHEAAKLPRLRELGLGARRLVTDAGMRALAGTSLEAIDLTQCAQVTKAGLAALPPTLRVLEAPECLGITGLPDQLVELRRLTLTFDAGLTDDIAPALARFVHLRELDLSNCPGLTKKIVEALPRLRSLEQLRLRGHDWIDDDVASACAALPELTRLDLGSTVDRYRLPSGGAFSGGVTKLTGRGVEALARLAKLNELHLAAAPELPVAAVRALKALPLRRLNLSWTPLRYDDETPSLADLRRAFGSTRLDWWAPADNRWPK